ncbi:protein FAM200A-like, partial [Aphis craccivora]
RIIKLLFLKLMSVKVSLLFFIANLVMLISSGNSEVEKHSNGKKHVKLLNSCKNQQSLTELIKDSTHAKLRNTMEVLKNVKILEPKTVFESEISSLGSLASQLPILTKNINLDDLDREWRKLKSWKVLMT